MNSAEKFNHVQQPQHQQILEPAKSARPFNPPMPLIPNPLNDMIPPPPNAQMMPPPNNMQMMPLPPNMQTMNASPMGDDFVPEVNRLIQQKSEMHCQALVGSLILVAGLITGLVLYFIAKISVGATIAIILSCYVVYLMVACCCNDLSDYLGNVERGQNFQNYYEWIRNSAGQFWFHAECYHYETRHHTRMRTDSHGHTHVEHYTTTEKVVTHSATENLIPKTSVDVSGAIERIHSQKRMVFIHFIVNHRFGDQISQANFNSFDQGFRMRHTFDTHQSFSNGFKVEGLVERQTFYLGELGCNLKGWYYAFGLLGLLWPYSLWVQSKIDRFRVQNTKVITL